MANKEKIKLFFAIFFLLGFSLLSNSVIRKKVFPSLGTSLDSNKLALADDEEGEKNRGESDDENAEAVSATPASSSSSSKPQTYTQIIKLPDQIVTKTVIEDVILIDTDKDGLADGSDPHPTIPEFIIVTDNNGNGIDDSYEIAVGDSNGNGVADNYEAIK